MKLPQWRPKLRYNQPAWVESQGLEVDKAPDAFRTISEVADDLDVPQHVLRFWETRFPQIKPMKRGGGRRYYRPDDVDLLRGIRHLLYGEGYTIRGVQRLLKDNGQKFVQGVWRGDEPVPPAPTEAEEPADLSVEVDETVQEAESEPEADDDARAAPRAAAPINGTVSTPSSPPLAPRSDTGLLRLSREDLHRLQAALYELGECRRLLEAAQKDE